MIVSDRFLKDVKGMWDGELLSGQGGRLVAGWCFDYFDQYGKAPGLHIQDIFEFNSSKGQVTPEEASFLEGLLGRLSQEHERADKLNVDYLLDQTEQYLKAQSLRHLMEGVKEALDVGDPGRAEAQFKEYKPINRATGMGLDPITDVDSIREAFEQDEEQLFTLPGALGKMMNQQLKRGAFIGFMAPEKRGKSFWLMEVAMRAYRSRCNVVIFEAGDMGKRERVLRTQSYIHQRPVGGKKRTVKVPFLEDENGGVVGYENREVEPLAWKEAYQGSVKWAGRMRGRHLKVLLYENSTLTVTKMRADLDRLEYFEGFIPDVVVVDYADIMIADDGRKEFRHQQNDVWKGLRALSQHYHCCLFTATQTDAASYEADTIKLKHFSEDKRKYGHVTAMYGLNQTDEEREQGILRIGEILVREGRFSAFRQVNVLQCLDIGRPYIASFSSTTP